MLICIVLLNDYRGWVSNFHPFISICATSTTRSSMSIVVPVPLVEYSIVPEVVVGGVGLGMAAAVDDVAGRRVPRLRHARTRQRSPEMLSPNHVCNTPYSWLLGTCRLGVRADGGRPKVRDADGRSRLDLNYS